MWYPPEEPLAASNLTAFVEWLRALRIRADADPDDVAAWAAEGSPTFAHAVLHFIGATPDSSLADLAGRWSGERDLLIRLGATRRRWSRNDFAGDPPGDIVPTMMTIRHSELAELIASHLLVAEIRPDDRVLWCGDATATWPLGSLALGATLILVERAAAPAEVTAALENATLVFADRPDPCLTFGRRAVRPPF